MMTSTDKGRNSRRSKVQIIGWTKAEHVEKINQQQKKNNKEIENDKKVGGENIRTKKTKTTIINNDTDYVYQQITHDK